MINPINKVKHLIRKNKTDKLRKFITDNKDKLDAKETLQLALYESNLSALNVLLNVLYDYDTKIMEELFVDNIESNTDAINFYLLNMIGGRTRAELNFYFRLACTYCKFEIMKYFVRDRRVDPKNKDNRALFYVSQNTHVSNDDYYKCMEFLLNKGCDPNTDDGWPLIYSIKRESLECIKLLVKHNADITIRNNLAYKISKRCKNKKIHEYLEELENGNAIVPKEN